MRSYHARPITIRTQHGAALLVMIVIMVVGIAAVLIASLSTSALNNARQEKTSAALAQAQEALIGRAVSDANRPGELPCPDVNGDGQLTLNVDFTGGSPPSCISLVGYLPWKTLGLSDLRDGENSKLWYALSQNFYAGNTVPLNSDTPGQLTITGLHSQTNIVAIVFSPGAPLCGQSQSTNNVGQYLEAISSVTATNADIAADSSDCGSTPYNDRLLAITADQVLHPVEIRIAREVKSCLDEYSTNALNIHHRYPWATTDTTNYIGTLNAYFGRVPLQPNAGGSTQAQLNSALNTAGNNVASSVAGVSLGIMNEMLYAGDWAMELATSNMHSVSSVQIKLNDAINVAQSLTTSSPNKAIVIAELNALQAALNSFSAGPGAGDSTMPATWTPTCAALFATNYWQVWRDQVFYQVAGDYQPNGPANTCPGGSNCLTINGTGSYPAIVIAARKAILIGGPPQIQSRANAAITGAYLERDNVHNAAGTRNSFETYSFDTPDYSIVNDLVLCLDGKVNCK